MFADLFWGHSVFAIVIWICIVLLILFMVAVVFVSLRGFIRTYHFRRYFGFDSGSGDNNPSEHHLVYLILKNQKEKEDGYLIAWKDLEKDSLKTSSVNEAHNLRSQVMVSKVRFESAVIMGQEMAKAAIKHGFAAELIRLGWNTEFIKEVGQKNSAPTCTAS